MMGFCMFAHGDVRCATDVNNQGKKLNVESCMFGCNGHKCAPTASNWDKKHKILCIWLQPLQVYSKFKQWGEKDYKI